MPKKILIIDDEEITTELMRNILVEHGYEVSTAGNGKEGIKKVKEFRPDVVLTDVLMPEMDGFMFYKELRKDPVYSSIPILVLTARGKMEDTFKSLGAEGFIMKPFDTDVLLSEIDRLISQSGSHIKTTPASSAGRRETPRNVKEVSPSPGTVSGQEKRILLYGTADAVLKEILAFFREEKCLAEIVTDEKKLVTDIVHFKPDMVFLQINADQETPVESLVTQVRSHLRKVDDFKARDPKSALHVFWDESPIILFKVDKTISGVDSPTGNIMDTSNLVQRCYANGASSYVGSYSPLSFKVRVRGFLKHA